MKRFFYSFLPFLFFACSGSTNNSMTANEYNDSIVSEQNKIIENIIKMSTDFANFEIADGHRMKIVEQCDLSINVLNAMLDYEGNTELRDGALALFKFYKEIAEKDFKRMLEIISIDEATEEDFAELARIEQDIAKRELPLDKAFQKAQKDFSEKYDMMLEKNEYQDLIDGK